MTRRLVLITFLSIVIVLVIYAASVYAEGSKQLNENGGYRAYTERYDGKTAGMDRLQEIKVFAKAGEKIYLGSSVSEATLDFTNMKMGTDFSSDELETLSDKDIVVASPNWKQGTNPDMLPYIKGAKDTSLEFYEVSKNSQGNITTVSQESAGPNINNTNMDGYDPLVYEVKTTGVHTLIFYSKEHTKKNPQMALASSSAWQENESTVAAWDATVTSSDNKIINGRTYVDVLFLNMGGNNSSVDVLNAKVYVVTSDGYQYKVDFNGMDPFGFMFYANNRGLLQGVKSGNSGEDFNYAYSLYHSVFSLNNEMSDLREHNIIINNIPYSESDDTTYRVFFNKPDKDALDFFNIPDPKDGNRDIKNLRFEGTDSSAPNVGCVGKGGVFKFEVSDSMKATSFQLELTFANAGGTAKRTLSNNIVKDGDNNTNSIYWDGKDDQGNVVDAGSYNQGNVKIMLKGGEIHFPLLDVENNRNGIKISRINGIMVQGDEEIQLNEDNADGTVYYNNSSELGIGDTTSPWSKDNSWSVADTKGTSTTGIDSLSERALQFSGTVPKKKDDSAMTYDLQKGDQCALDIWSYYKVEATMQPIEFQLIEPNVKTTLTIIKKWENEKNAIAKRPDSVTVQIYQDDEPYGDEVKLLEDDNWSYKVNDIPAAHEYTIKETTIDNYKTTSSDITGNAEKGYKVTVTNKYTGAKNETNSNDPESTNGIDTGDSLLIELFILLLITAGIVLSVLRKSVK